MIHQLSDVKTSKVGEGTSIWQYCVVLEGAVIGKDCNICSHCFIENDVVIGNRVTIKCGVQIWDGVKIEDDVFVGPGVNFCNDRYPISKNKNFELERTLVGAGSSIGANATILPGVKIGCNCVIGAGSIVADDVPDGAIVRGQKSKIYRKLIAEK